MESPMGTTEEQMLDNFFLTKVYPFYVRTTWNIPMSPWFRGFMHDLAVSAVRRMAVKRRLKEAKAGARPKG